MRETRDIRDGAWRLFDWQPATGRTVWVLHNGDGSMTFRTDYPVENLIRENRRFSNETLNARFGEMSRVASIPLNVYHDSGLAEAQLQQDDKFISRFLNDSDNSAWRTREGRV